MKDPMKKRLICAQKCSGVEWGGVGHSGVGWGGVGWDGVVHAGVG